MPGSDSVFAGAVPDIYDRLLVPALFAPFAADLALRVAALEPYRVLEIAAGTGAVTRALAERLPAQARIVATDLNPAMLETAARHGPDPRIRWQQADAMALPFEDGVFDAVICQFGVMFLPDKAQGLREVRRVLVPGGTLMFNVWDRLAVNDFAQATTEALAAVFPSDPPRFMARTPYGYSSLDKLYADVEAAGLADFAAAVVNHTGRMASARELAIGFCQGTPLRGEIEERAPGRLDEVTEAVVPMLKARFGPGTIEGRLRAIMASAVRHDDGPGHRAATFLRGEG
ncbi:class I SAM-dependent methyltransferase [Ancylobacter defluvii]|uniref:Ubiquinone/menaquinone biosynthesis methyltransferase n=1 Tax=Ancylobacter defluvii TaxID=1282440 RepID=A0A9W6K4E5_9HYPH|nr:methyltransferase domain-containing protein [Ancylobacter defluvii]MBS7588393.1 methyltransferase domain-containing protein [Ancylobacter defluvii]GLK86798.1 ubiquinone/menaquinone biosynthesis methyltransferase [Ancylobacter defluvii]